MAKQAAAKAKARPKAAPSKQSGGGWVVAGGLAGVAIAALISALVAVYGNPLTGAHHDVLLMLQAAGALLGRSCCPAHAGSRTHTRTPARTREREA